MKKILTLMSLLVAIHSSAAPKKISPVISQGADGHLIYDLDEHGNRVPDFSTCGYAGADRPIPNSPVRVTVSPRDGDETSLIQRALFYVANLPADANGIRGAVLLLKGRHQINGSLLVSNSGVVLRGQGMGPDGTILFAAGNDRRTLLRILGGSDLSSKSNAGWDIADNYVPVGATKFSVKDAGELKAGDTIQVTRASSKSWIEKLGMTEFGGGIGDWRCVWHAGKYDVAWDRVIQKIEGNLVSVDSPITTAIEKEFGGGNVKLYSWPGRLTNVGIENLSLESACDAANPRDENHSWFAITMENASDAWVRQVTFKHFAGSAVAVYETCKRVTVEDCLSLAPVSEEAGWRRDTFFTLGQQTLFLRCHAENGRHDFALGFCAPGPNAFVQCEADLAMADSGAIQSWASGALFDNVRIDGGGLSLMNRGPDGAGAGWSAANSVLWQCSAARINCENPPGAKNWAFGCWGEFQGDGIWREANASVRPVSLYVAQVSDRRGKEVADKIPLLQHNSNEFSNPTVEQAAELIRMSRNPPPQLADFIASAGKREPIPIDPAQAADADKIPHMEHTPSRTRHALVLTNGWLTCDGKLLIGGVKPVNWWRGNMRPNEGKEYGVTLSRFAPGRIGPGFTDDLSTLAGDMISREEVALDHHYGLWYDRRREDHERVRRASGDVWAPFYEQPFARTGTGLAWDGLSKYDLTKPNPWYWSRLKEFAGICDERGLVLFNENYFQHNILEAGAHWVDCPWRSANNVNETGFPEPPPFAGDKRIFMAGQFYDASHPVRRKLHEAFIRQNLENFADEPNVIQFTSAEFTGPLAFQQFWLDTIGGWERETHKHPLIALAATKDVQDAILDDPARAAVVDVICFRYWWEAGGEVFAPRGGENLSPRQSERKWKGARPSDEDLARMASSCSAKFPGKAIIASGEDAALRGSWAFVCAGGSMPELPASTDARLLAAIPQMRPWPEAGTNHSRALREPGRQMLIDCRGNSDAKIDLSGETGVYHVNIVNPKNGSIASQSKTIPAGGKTTLPSGLIWLVHE